jgi:integrase
VILKKRCRHSEAEWEECSCAWYADRYVNGKRQYQNLGRDRQEAQKRFANLEDGSFAEVADRWLASLHVRQKTYANYSIIVRSLKAHFTKLNDIPLASYESKLKARKLKQSTIKNHRLILKAILRMAEDEGLTKAPRIGSIWISNKVEYLTPTQFRNLNAEPVYEFLYLTGLRAGELLGLREEDIDHQAKSLRIHRQKNQSGEIAPLKTESSYRTVDLSDRAYEIIPLLDMGYHTLLRGWHKHKKTGLHILRHSNVALRIAAKQDVLYIANQLGHSDPGFTLKVYGHLIPMPNAANALDGYIRSNIAT